jgi:Domain of unknown function (DUF6398)
MSKPASSIAVPKSIKSRYDEIVALTDAFCQKHLNDEYAGLARRMAAALSRKRPSPLASGQPRTWACGILHALGQINFLSDPATNPHMPKACICSAFRVGQSTASAKAAAIRNAVNAHSFDPNWSLQSLADQNPFLWMLDINGLIVDIRNAPEEIQQLALANGLIPYLPHDKS